MIHAARQKILDRAFRANGNRFVNKTPQPPTKPTAVWINPPNHKLAKQAQFIRPAVSLSLTRSGGICSGKAGGRN